MSAKEVGFDHDEIEYAVKNIRAFANRILEELTGGADRMFNTASREMSANTRDNCPAPIYADLLDNISTARVTIGMTARGLARKLHAVADALEQADAAARDTTDGAVDAVNHL